MRLGLYLLGTLILACGSTLDTSARTGPTTVVVGRPRLQEAWTYAIKSVPMARVEVLMGHESTARGCSYASEPAASVSIEASAATFTFEVPTDNVLVDLVCPDAREGGVFVTVVHADGTESRLHPIVGPR